jgi:hypothetical protein
MISPDCVASSLENQHLAWGCSPRFGSLLPMFPSSNLVVPFLHAAQSAQFHFKLQSVHSPSTIGPPSFFAANPQLLNMYKLATAIPSLLSYSVFVPGSTYRQWSPAPASNSTETKNRSIKRRVISKSSHPDFFHSSSKLAMRGTPPTSKCCQRP